MFGSTVKALKKCNIEPEVYNKWINANNEIPSCEGEYLVFHAGFYGICMWSAPGHGDNKGFHYCEVTHWMILPEEP